MLISPSSDRHSQNLVISCLFSISYEIKRLIYLFCQIAYRIIFNEFTSLFREYDIYCQKVTHILEYKTKVICIHTHIHKSKENKTTTTTKIMRKCSTTNGRFEV